MSGLGVVKGRDLSKKVRIYDTTLRDGEQSPGISLTVDDKVTIARMLDALGVDCIEAGFAASNEADRKVFVQLMSDGLNADVYTLSRCVKGDIDAAIECGLRHIHLFIATSDIHLKQLLSKCLILWVLSDQFTVCNYSFVSMCVLIHSENDLSDLKISSRSSVSILSSQSIPPTSYSLYKYMILVSGSTVIHRTSELFSCEIVKIVSYYLCKFLLKYSFLCVRQIFRPI